MLIALGVSGGIAAYKACEIIRGLDRAGAEVQVLLTRNATEFITPLTLQTLSRRKVLLEPFDLGEERTIQHIELTRRTDALLVAPATANLLAKFAAGIADDLLSTFHLAVTAPLVLAPAMNTRMWNHPATRTNVALLRERGAVIVDPESGWLAEGESGWGRLADPARIVERTLQVAWGGRDLAGSRVVVTAGPTREAIDPVRFLSNRSSGKMGFALAEACARRGAEVTLIAGPVNLPTPPGVRRLDVESAAEMGRALEESRDGADAVLMAAAVADYLPRASDAKIKKTGDGLTLELDEGVDILAGLGRERKERLLVGFAAETENLLENASAKLERKNCDFIIANDVSTPGVGIDADDNAVTILGRDGSARHLPRESKTSLARRIVEHLFPVEPKSPSDG